MRATTRMPSMATFESRRRLSAKELLPAIGVGVSVGVGTGLLAAYVARLFLMREKLRGGRDAPGLELPSRREERG